MGLVRTGCKCLWVFFFLSFFMDMGENIGKALEGNLSCAWSPTMSVHGDYHFTCTGSVFSPKNRKSN